jgi:hypothetical protein
LAIVFCIRFIRFDLQTKAYCHDHERSPFHSVREDIASSQKQEDNRHRYGDPCAGISPAKTV